MKLRVTVEGRVYDVDVELLESTSGDPRGANGVVIVPRNQPSPAAKAAPPPAPKAKSADPAPKSAERAAPSGQHKTLNSPLTGVILSLSVNVGDEIAKDGEVLVLEAMKMETSVYMVESGKIVNILVSEGDRVKVGDPLIEYD